MVDLNRRRFLRSTATAGIATTAIGGVAVMAIPAAAADHPDADLLALGTEFDRLFADYKPLMMKVQEVQARYGADLLHVLGSIPNDHPFWSEWSAACEPFEDELEAVTDKLQAVCERMQALSAITVAGFAVKARTLRFTMCKWGDSPDPMLDWDLDDECLERFIREIETAAGGRAIA